MTTSPGRLLFSTMIAMSSGGFMVGCSSLRLGRSTMKTLVCALSPYQREPS
jgi:hypothetical protein